MRILEYCNWLANPIYFLFFIDDMSNIITTQHHEKKGREHAVIAMIVTFALLTCYVLPTSDIFAAAPNDPDKTGCNPKTDTDCFPDEIVVFDNPINTHLLVLDSQTTSSNTPKDSSVDIEGGDVIVVGCKGGAAGEVPGKPGVCKEDSQTTSSNTPKDSSVDIEADELVVKGCKGGTAGEVLGKKGVCKE